MFKYIKTDLPASIFVFFVVFPWCFCIALASGPLLSSGLIAAILFIVGYKLAKSALFKKMDDLGWKQFIPFTVTVLGIVFVDLLYGTGLGLMGGIIVILVKSYQNSPFSHKKDFCNGIQKEKTTLVEKVYFFNKNAILKDLNSLPKNSFLGLVVRKTRCLDNDIFEILEDFAFKAKERNISIKVVT
jgi:MFS superfamily sulfate permease-like transporter